MYVLPNSQKHVKKTDDIKEISQNGRLGSYDKKE